jgi:hypothetical protein
LEGSVTRSSLFAVQVGASLECKGCTRLCP